MSDTLRFRTEAGEVPTTVAAFGPEPDAPGTRVIVEFSAADLQRAYDLGAFDLPATIPGGDVPGVDTSKPVLVELRLIDEADALLATSSRKPGVLLGDMVARSQAGGSHLLLEADRWQVASVRQDGRRRRPGLFITTLHDNRPTVPAGATDDNVSDDPAFDTDDPWGTHVDSAAAADSDLIQRIVAHIAEEPGIEQLSPTVWRFPFDGDEGPFSVFVAVQDDTLICTATRIDAVPAERIGEMRELAADLNGITATAAFDCDLHEGVVGARAAVDMTGVPPSDNLIGNIIGAPVEAFIRFQAAVEAIANGELNVSDIRTAPDPQAVPKINIDTATDAEVEAFLNEQFRAGD